MKKTFKQHLDKQFNQVPASHILELNLTDDIKHGDVPPGTYVVLPDQALRLLKLPMIHGGFTEHYIGTLNSGEPQVWFGKGSGHPVVSKSLTDAYDPNWSERLWQLCTGQIPLLRVTNRGSFTNLSVQHPLRVDPDTGFLVYEDDGRIVGVDVAHPSAAVVLPTSVPEVPPTPTRQEMVRRFAEEVMALELWESAANLVGEDLYSQSPSRFVIGEYPDGGRCDSPFVILPAMERTTSGHVRRVRFVVIADYEDGFPLGPSDLIPLEIHNLVGRKQDVRDGLFRLLTGVARTWNFIGLTYRLETSAGAFVPYP